MVHPESPQAGVALGEDRLARQPGPVRPVPHPTMHLGGDDQLVPVPVLGQGATDDLLARPGGVDVRRVEEVDAGLDRRPDQRPTLRPRSASTGVARDRVRRRSCTPRTGVRRPVRCCPASGTPWAHRTRPGRDRASRTSAEGRPLGEPDGGLRRQHAGVGAVRWSAGPRRPAAATGVGTEVAEAVPAAGPDEVQHVAGRRSRPRSGPRRSGAGGAAGAPRGRAPAWSPTGPPARRRRSGRSRPAAAARRARSPKPYELPSSVPRQRHPAAVAALLGVLGPQPDRVLQARRAGRSATSCSPSSSPW